MSEMITYHFKADITFEAHDFEQATALLVTHLLWVPIILTGDRQEDKRFKLPFKGFVNFDEAS